jgi:predicted transposase/invertase (TIGR01784 family)
MSKKQRPLISFDWAIKNVLRQKPNFVILEGFLSELLKQDVKINNILESESNSYSNEEKINKIDILCESIEKEIFLIELQYNSEIDYFYRMLYGASKIITNHMKSGFQYSEVKKVYSVNIVYFDLGHGDDYVYYGTTNFEGIHKHDVLDLSKSQKEIFKHESISKIFPEYYIIKVNKFNDHANTSLDEWIYYLKNSELPYNYSAKGLEEAEEILNIMQMNEQERIDYDAHQKSLAISYNVIETAKIESREAGREEGLAIGKAEGIAEESARALSEKETIVCNAYDKVKDINFVAEITSFSNEQVIEILKKNGLL